MDSDSKSELIEPLTARERQILRLLSEGLTNREIGQRLHLSYETIKWYNKQIYDKLAVSNRTEAAARALVWGLLEEGKSAAEVKAAPRSNLPASITPFIGRQDQIAELVHLFREQAARLVTLTGPGGIGKTRLALEVARQLSPSHGDGTMLVSLAQLDRPERVPWALTATFELEIPAERDPTQVLKGFLRERRVLLLLDNYEHLVDAAPLVVELLSAAPGLKMLVTSRQPLRVYGETVYVVPPLAYPMGDRSVARETLLDFESAALFHQRAKAANPTYQLTQDNVDLVAAICRRLQGLPLALELAAARLKQLELSDLETRLGRSLAELQASIEGVPDRQKTLAATIAWSYDLLEDIEKEVFSDLSVFHGGFTKEAAEQVLMEGASGEVAAGVEALAEKGLLVRHGKVHDRYRFSMLEVIHEFSRSLAAPETRRYELKRQHARYFTEWVEASGPRLAGPDQGASIRELQAEEENIRSALEWTLSGAEPELGLRLIGSQSAYWWYFKGFSEESLHWVELALRFKEEVEPATRAGLETIAGHVLMQFDQFERARSLMTEALAFYEKLGDKRRVAWLLASLSFTLVGKRDRYQEALGQCERSIAMFKEVDDPQYTAAAFNIKGHIARAVGDMDTAKQAYDQALRMAQLHGNTRREAHSFVYLGIVEQARGDYQRAIALLQKGLRLSHRIGHDLVTALALGALAGPLTSLNRPAKAACLLGGSMALRDASGTTLEVIDEPVIEAYAEGVQASLGEEGYLLHFDQGRTLDLTSAIELALAASEEE